MEDAEDERSANVIPRHRSPIFDNEEVKVLLQLVIEYKMILLNKSNTATAIRAKEVTWTKIAQKFNSHGFDITRSADVLRNKWRNLGRYARRKYINLLHDSQDESDEFSNQVLSILHDEYVSNGDIVLPSDIEDALKEMEQVKDDDDVKQCSDDKVEEKGEDSNGDDVKIIRNRSMNFSSPECKILIQCVKAEKKYALSKGNTRKEINAKKCAWARITEQFNKRSARKRTTKVLHTKFNNIKHANRKESSSRNTKWKPDRLFEENASEDPAVKLEPLFEEEKTNEDDDKINGEVEGEVSEADRESMEYPDPLCTVLNSDSGLGSSVHVDSFNPFENNEVVKLKLELLKHKIENSKLERKRLEIAIQQDAKDQELRNAERSLRLRAARLEAIAAEMKLPVDHRALLYTPEENEAQTYLKRYQT